jgi:glycosyltransferase involved in cell wall biosynthesis
MGFLLVVNQFWAHKNHACVVEAMGRLRREGRCPQVVMIGLPVDYRDRSGRTLSGLLGRIAELGLEGEAKILGFVEPGVRDALLRACRALVQPSLAEGWSTSVEDAKALGRPVLTADTAVLREQAPGAFGRFAPDDPGACAAVLERAGQELPPGPDPAREAAALERAAAAAREAGRTLRTIVEEARQARDARLGRTPEGEAP